MKMNITYARALLNITEDENLQSLKKKYHRLISACHPDVLGSEKLEHIKMAQEINEAYQFLKRELETGAEQGAGTRSGKNPGRSTKKNTENKPPVWSGKINEKAFKERNIYLYYSMDLPEEESKAHPYYQTARGKYLWDPKEEDFSLFLISIHTLVKKLLEKSGNNQTDVRAQSRLFQYLAEQFIDPLKALKQIAKPAEKDQEQREIYRFKAHLKMSGRRILKEGMFLYPKAFKENKILVQDENKIEYGHVSFEDDRLYFIILPLLKAKMGKVRMEYQKGKVDFYFRLEKDVKPYEIPDRNPQIAQLLNITE